MSCAAGRGWASATQNRKRAQVAHPFLFHHQLFNLRLSRSFPLVTPAFTPDSLSSLSLVRRTVQVNLVGGLSKECMFCSCNVGPLGGHLKISFLFLFTPSHPLFPCTPSPVLIAATFPLRAAIHTAFAPVLKLPGRFIACVLGRFLAVPPPPQATHSWTIWCRKQNC